MHKNTPHIHAELMKQYAEDAAETDKPWERWERKICNCQWECLSDSPRWSESVAYRRKPRTININGHEVPEPYRGEMEMMQGYYVPDVYDRYGTGIYRCTWVGDSFDKENMQRGFVHLTPEAATMHRNALLSFTEVEK